MKIIKRGRFYWHKDNSIKYQHPSYIYKKNDKKNKYYLLCFTSSKGKRRTKLNRNINKESNKDCYVLNSPRISKRKDIKNEIYGFRIDKVDKPIINKIKKKK